MGALEDPATLAVKKKVRCDGRGHVPKSGVRREREAPSRRHEVLADA
jgi:hypothetical protein